MIAVWTRHRRPFRVGERTYHPVEATLVPEIDGSMRLQAANLRTLEVEGPDDPRLKGVRLRDERGDPIERPSVDLSEHAAVVEERDQAQAELRDANATIATLTAERDKVKADLKTANDALAKAAKAEPAK